MQENTIKTEKKKMEKKVDATTKPIKIKNKLIS